MGTARKTRDTIIHCHEQTADGSDDLPGHLSAAEVGSTVGAGWVRIRIVAEDCMEHCLRTMPFASSNSDHLVLSAIPEEGGLI